MQTEHLHEFLDLVDTLNFTKSAQRLHLSQSTLSRHIAALEDDLGVVLFDRTNDHVTLTRAGKALYEKARLVMGDLNDLLSGVEQAMHEEVVTLKVNGSTVQPTANRFMSRMAARAILEGLPLRFEYTRVRSISGEQPIPSALDLLQTGEADFLIEILPPDSPSFDTFETMELCREPLRFFVSPHNPLAERKNLKIEDLKGSRLALFSVYPHCPSVFEGILQSAGFAPQSIRTVFISDLLGIPEALLGLEDDEVNTLQANFVAAQGFGDDGMGGVRMLDMHDERAVVTFYAVWRKGDERPALAQAIDLAQRTRDSYKKSPSPAAYQLVEPAFA